jgi:hypothetical protein
MRQTFVGVSDFMIYLGKVHLTPNLGHMKIMQCIHRLENLATSQEVLF